MAVFLQLRGQSAASGRLILHVEHLAKLRQCRHGEARPVHRRVGQRLRGVEQLTVLDEQQAADHQRRDAGEVGVPLLRIAKFVERRTATIADAQATLALLGKGREQAAATVGHQLFGEARLLGDLIIALLQALQHQWQVGIALAFVERAIGRVDDPLAGAWFDLVRQVRGIATELA